MFQDDAFTKRIHQVCDSVVQLDSFVGSEKEKNPAFKEYHGKYVYHSVAYFQFTN